MILRHYHHKNDRPFQTLSLLSDEVALEQAFYHPEYHGKVFGLSEIDRVIDLFGIPDREWQTDLTTPFLR